MENQHYVSEFFRLIAGVYNAGIQKDIQENVRGENCLLLYLSEHGGSAAPGDICGVLGVTNARIAAITKSLERKEIPLPRRRRAGQAPGRHNADGRGAHVHHREAAAPHRPRQ